MSQETALKKIKDINVPESRLFGGSLPRTFVEDIHYLREKIAARFESMTTAILNLGKEYGVSLEDDKGFLNVRLYCLGIPHETWYLGLNRQGDVSFTKHSKAGEVQESYEIPYTWDDSQILNFKMPEQVVIEHLCRTKWTPICLLTEISKKEAALYERLEAQFKKAQKEVEVRKHEAMLELGAMKDALAHVLKAQDEIGLVQQEVQGGAQRKQQMLALLNEQKRRAQADIEAAEEKINTAQKEIKELKSMLNTQQIKVALHKKSRHKALWEYVNCIKEFERAAASLRKKAEEKGIELKFD